MWADNETSDDLIGFQVHADLIRNVVSDDRMLPVTIGLFGDWGGGKTSIMKMLQRDLAPDQWSDQDVEQTLYQDVAVVYFNGWLFEGYDDAKSAILSSIRYANCANVRSVLPRTPVWPHLAIPDRSGTCVVCRRPYRGTAHDRCADAAARHEASTTKPDRKEKSDRKNPLNVTICPEKRRSRQLCSRRVRNRRVTH